MDLKTTLGILKQIITLLIVICVTSLYLFHKHIVEVREHYFIKWIWTDTISCHYATEKDALPPAEELNPPPNSIFFHETSCRGGLTSREACAVESAARKHPRRPVYLFFNSPVSEVVLTKSCLAELAQFENVNIARLHTVQYARGTALYEMLARKDNEQSYFKIELTSDMLRYISLYKYGGLYLDTDVLVVRPLDRLGENWVAREDDESVNVAVLAIGKNGIGHELVSQILNDLKSDYRPNEWLHHGPGAMARALLKACNATEVSDLNTQVCHGFKVYQPSLIYPVHWSDATSYFEVGRLPADRSEAFTHHLWNKMTRNTTLEKGSPFDELAKKHCPTIREMYGDKFGT